MDTQWVVDRQVIVDMARLDDDDGYRVAACAWAEANGLDPHRISADSPITLDPDGRTFRYLACVTDDDGQPVLERGPSGWYRVAIEERTADMRVPFTP